MIDLPLSQTFMKFEHPGINPPTFVLEQYFLPGG